MKLIKDILKANSLKIINKIYVFVIVIFGLLLFFVGYSIYIKTSGLMAENVNLQISQTVGQSAKYINEKLDFTLWQLINLELDGEFKEIVAKSGDSHYLSDFSIMAEKFEKIRMQNGSIIESIFFLRDDKKIFYEYLNTLNTDLVMENTDWYKKTKENKNMVMWTESRYLDVFKNYSDKRVFSISVNILNAEFKSQGILMFNIKESFLKNELTNINFGDFSTLFILNCDNNKIVSATLDDYNNPNIPKEIYDKIASYTEQAYTKVNINSSSNILVYNQLPVNNWVIGALVPESNHSYDLEILGRLTFYLVLFAIFLFAFVSLFFIKIITEPINNLVGIMKNVGNGNLKARFFSQSKDEITELGYTFNNMLDNIEKLMQEVSEERERKLIAQLTVLQEQINSHFLYNTLDSIYWEAKEKNADSAAQMAVALAKFIRHSLNQGQEVTTVRDEIEHIKNYITIQKYRYEDRLECVFNIDENTQNAVVPKLILQPLVENSIIHGIDELEEKGIITIDIYKKDSFLCLKVSDNGVGMDVEKVIKEMQEHKVGEKTSGYALYNLCARLKMRYNSYANIEFFYNKPNGVVAVLSLPYITKEELKGGRSE